MAMEKVVVTTKSEVQSKHFNAHPAYEYDKYDVVPRNGGNRCAVTVYDIAPGKSSYPFHYHADSEEIFYIISGHGVVETNDGDVAIAPGSIIFCPVGEGGAHRITNTSENEVLTYIDIDTIPKVDMAVYPKTGKVGIFTNEGLIKIYKTDGTVPYYEGE